MMNNPNNQDRSLSGFLAYLGNERNASEHTLESYKMDIVQFSKLTLNLDAAEQAVDWDSVSVHDARSFVVALQGEDLSKTSIVRKISGLRSFYRYLEREHIVGSNPFAGLVSPKKQKLLPKYMTIAEVSRLLDSADTFWNGAVEKGIAKSEEGAKLSAARDGAILEVIYSGGLRISEALGLNLGSVDLLGGVMKVRGKGKKERICGLGGPAERALRKYIHVRALWSAFRHDAAQTPPFLCNASSGRRRGPAQCSGTSRTRKSEHHADLHSYQRGTPQSRLQQSASARITQSKESAWILSGINSHFCQGRFFCS